MSFPARAQLGDASSGDPMKAIWSVVPFSVIRVSGGSGKWTDPLTHATLTDAGTDLRKSAVVASAIGAFNDQNNFWYDTVSQQHLTPAQAYARWQQLFGSATFAQAYGAFPSQFVIFQPTNATGDPAIHGPGAMPVPSPAAPPIPAPALVPAQVPVTSASASPQQVAASPVLSTAALVPSSGLTPSTLLVLALVGAGVVLASRRGGGRV